MTKESNAACLEDAIRTPSFFDLEEDLFAFIEKRLSSTEDADIQKDGLALKDAWKAFSSHFVDEDKDEDYTEIEVGEPESKKQKVEE